MVSSVRAAMKHVHTETPAAGVSRIETKLGHWLAGANDSNRGRKASATAAFNYIETVRQCAEWHEESILSYAAWEAKGVVKYDEGDSVAALVRVVLEDAIGSLTGRLLFWDSLDLTPSSALILASPAVEVLDGIYGADNVRGIEVWQCRTRERHDVPSDQARLARPIVARHLREI